MASSSFSCECSEITLPSSPFINDPSAAGEFGFVAGFVAITVFSFLEVVDTCSKLIIQNVSCVIS